MAIDSKLNLSSKYFSQSSGETLNLSGITRIAGNFEYINPAPITGDTQFITKGYFDGNGANAFTYTDGLIKTTGGTIGIGGVTSNPVSTTINNTFTLNAYQHDLNVNGFNGEDISTTGITTQGYDEFFVYYLQGGGVYDGINYELFCGDGTISGAFYPTVHISLNNGGDITELVFSINGLLPDGWSGATITDSNSYLFNAYCYDRYIMVHEGSFANANLEGDVLIYDLLTQTVERVSDFIPSIANFAFAGTSPDDIKQKNIFKDLTLAGDDDGYTLTFYDRTTNILHHYDKETDTIYQISSGDTITGDLTAFPNILNATESNDSDRFGVNKNKVIIDVNTTDFNTKYYEYQWTTSGITSINVISEASVNDIINGLSESDILDFKCDLSSDIRQNYINYVTKTQLITLSTLATADVYDFPTSVFWGGYLSDDNGVSFNPLVFGLGGSTSDFTYWNNSQRTVLTVFGNLSYDADVETNINGSIANNTYVVKEQTTSFPIEANTLTPFTNTFTLDGNGFTYPSGVQLTNSNQLATLSYVTGKTNTINGLTNTSQGISLGGVLTGDTTIQTFAGNIEFDTVPTPTVNSNVFTGGSFGNIVNGECNVIHGCVRRNTITTVSSNLGVNNGIINHSFIGGDNHNIESSSSSLIVGSCQGIVGGSNTSLIFGAGNTITGSSRSLIGGCNNNVIFSNYSLIVGRNHSISYSSGGFVQGQGNNLSYASNGIVIGANSTSRDGSVPIAIGSCSEANDSNAISIGRLTKADSSGSIAIGNCVNAYGVCSINISSDLIGNTRGTKAIGSAIFGGKRHNIESGNTRATIVGGYCINLTGNSYIDTTAVSKLAIMDVPSTGTSGDTILVRDSSTGIIKEVAQTSVGSSLTFNNGLTDNDGTVSLGGTLTGDTVISTNNNGVVIGYSGVAVASGNNSIAFGFACATGSYSFAANGGTSTNTGSAAFGFACATGSRSIAGGQNSIASGNRSFAMGTNANATSIDTFAIGGNTLASGVNSFVGGKGNSRTVTASGKLSFNFSYNSPSQVIGHGAIANYSAILGGRNHNIESGNTRAAIIGGNTIKLTGNTYIDTTAMSNLAIMSTPQAGSSGDTILVRNSSTGIIKELSQGNDTEIIFNNEGVVSGNSVFTFSANTQSLTHGIRWDAYASGYRSVVLGGDNYGIASGNYSTSISLGAAYGDCSVSIGRSSRACGGCSIAVKGGGAYGLNSFSVGSQSRAYGDDSVTIGVNSSISAFGDKSMVIGGNFHCACASSSSIFGGCSNKIQTGNTNATIIGGGSIDLTGSTYIDTTAVSKLAIIDIPVTGDSSTGVLVRDSSTGIIQERAQADVASASDSRLKNLLQPISGVLDGISALNAYEYEFNDLIKPESLKGKTRYGLIAQELETVFPHVVEDDYSIGDETYKSVRYTEIIPILVKAIQELREEINSLKNR